VERGRQSATVAQLFRQLSDRVPYPNIFWEILFPEFPLTYYDLTGMLGYK